jgi:dihydrolipoyl dehydrogenase
VFDRVLVAVGRTPNGAGLGLDTAGVTVDDRGFIPVDEQRRTNVPHIFAIGDVTPGPMLAHKATAEAHVAAEVIAGHNVAFEPRGIPNVAYTEPEVAWVGLNETEAKEQGIAYESSVFPWSASGRALAIDGESGSTKLLRDPESGRILGGGIVGPSAGELIAEVGFALEMGADVGDLALTIHPHPTLSETVTFAAEIADGTITDLPNKAAMRAAKAKEKTAAA